MLLKEGLYNWKLRLILSALLAIMGLGAMISMILGLFVPISVFEKTLVAVAIFMAGVPTYLIVSGLGQLDEFTIANFLNKSVEGLPGNAELLAKNDDELDDEELEIRKNLIVFLAEHPVVALLPIQPVRQAYFVLLSSMIVCYAIWYFS